MVRYIVTTAVVLFVAIGVGACSKSSPGTLEGECAAEACNQECVSAGKAGGVCGASGCQCTAVDVVADADSMGGGDLADTREPKEVWDVADVGGDGADVHGDVPADKTEPKDEGAEDVDVGTPCTLESVLTDCAAGQGCVLGHCDACGSASDCASGLGCAEGVCGACETGEQCRAGEGCKNDLCGACTKADQCAQGLACVTGECTQCGVPQDCFGQLCTEGLCVPCYQAASCEAQYGPEYVCESGKCTRTTCGTDADCMLDGRLCSTQTWLCVDCEANSECVNSAAYGAGFLCLGGRCEQGNCQTNQDCPIEAPICGQSHQCRGCQASAGGLHGECIDKYGAGWLCLTGGACGQGNCTQSKECGVLNKGLCPTAEEVGLVIGGQTVAAYTCRPCVDHDEDARCRTEYGLDNLICSGGKCVDGCSPGMACGFKQVCGQDRWCGACVDNTQCAAAYGGDYSCVQGYCQPVQCDFDKPCLPGLICDNYVCRNCLEHSECPVGQVCDLGATDTCKVGQCTKSTEQELCWSYLCKSNQCVACGEGNPCGDGRFCGLDGVCYVGDCAVDADCLGSAQPCREWKCLQGAAGQRSCAEVVTPGAPCDEGNKCAKSSCLVSGACLPYEYTCDDGMDCTEDLCSPATGVCNHSVRPFRCLIGDVCYYAGDALTDEVTPFVCDAARCGELCTSLGFTVATCQGNQDCVCSLAPEVTPQKCTSSKCQYNQYPWAWGMCFGDWKCEIDLYNMYEYNCYNSECSAECAKFGYGWTSKCQSLSVCVCTQTIPTICQTATCNEACAEAGFASGSCTSGYACTCKAAANVDLRCMVCNPDAGQKAWFSDNSRCMDESACSEDVCGDYGCYHFENVSNACSINVLGVDTCFANGAANPGNPCEVCDTTKTKTAWTKRAAGFKCGFCQECNSSGSCLGVSNKETSPPSCESCRWCGGANTCKPAAHGEDPKNDCGEPTPVAGCGTNGHCDGNGMCDKYGQDDSSGQVNDGMECTTPDYCQNGVITGTNDELRNCGNISLMHATPIYQNCRNGECKPCSDLILGGNWNPCADGLLCCSGYCKPTCCVDSDCPSGKQCKWKTIVPYQVWSCH